MTAGRLIITYVSDDGGQFAKEVYDYLHSKLAGQGIEAISAPDAITLHVGSEEGGDQIHIDRSVGIPQEMVKNTLKSYLASDPARFKDYEVIELGETFTIGRVLPTSEMEMLTCEICGFFTPYSAELYTQDDAFWGMTFRQNQYLS